MCVIALQREKSKNSNKLKLLKKKIKKSVQTRIYGRKCQLWQWSSTEQSKTCDGKQNWQKTLEQVLGNEIKAEMKNLEYALRMSNVKNHGIYRQQQFFMWDRKSSAKMPVNIFKYLWRTYKIYDIIKNLLLLCAP